jgi:hypothetical protein
MPSTLPSWMTEHAGVQVVHNLSDDALDALLALDADTLRRRLLIERASRIAARCQDVAS